MGLEAIPEVGINDNKFSKFVVVDGPGRHYIHGVYLLTLHRALFNDFLGKVKKEGLDASQFKCQGGGSLDWQGKKIKAYGESAEFGKFNVDVVAQLLSRYIRSTPELEGFDLEVE